ncbi:MAG: toll/interleukin-1 receptor domain-containing protein [Chthonomonadales bacterium]|nr:toll/interleukin-1 receptor domain-containing protein [Chthonomonadales bacterium]
MGSSPLQPTQTQPPEKVKWDVFICHASEDKDEVVRPLVRLLEEKGISCWVDEQELTIGDSLRQKIDEGLAHSRYAVVVLSEAFFNKHWPRLELDGLTARQAAGAKVILPIWHRVTAQRVCEFSPMLGGRRAVSTADGLEHVVLEVCKALGDPCMPSEQVSRASAPIEVVGVPWVDVTRCAVGFRIRRGTEEHPCFVGWSDLEDLTHSSGESDYLALFRASLPAILDALRNLFATGTPESGDLVVTLFDAQGNRV